MGLPVFLNAMHQYREPSQNAMRGAPKGAWQGACWNCGATPSTASPSPPPSYEPSEPPHRVRHRELKIGVAIVVGILLLGFILFVATVSSIMNMGT